MNQILKAIEKGCTHYGAQFRTGFLKQYNEILSQENKFPMFYVLPVEISPEFIDDNPTLYVTYSINGFIIDNRNAEEIKSKDLLDAEDLFLKLIYYLNFNYDGWSIEAMEAQPMPENFFDRAYGLRVSFEIKKHVKVKC